MANLTYGVIRGEKNLDTYCMMRWKKKPLFIESFAHNIDTVTIERIYAIAPTDDGYQPYYILSMETTKDTPYFHHESIRAKVYEDIRTGRVNLIKV